MSFMSNDFLCGFFLGGVSMSFILILIYSKCISELRCSNDDLERKNKKLIHFIKYRLPPKDV